MIKRILKNQRNTAWEQNKLNIIKLLSELDLPRDSKMLDLGCDDGTWSLELAQASKIKEIIGVEILKERGELAEKKGIRVLYADLADKLPIERESVRLVHANQVIEHLSDTDNFVEEIHRVLEPNGYALISTEILSSWHNIFALILGYNPFSLTNISSKKAAIGNPLAFHNTDEFSWPGTSWQHRRIFTIRSITDLFNAYGFELDEVLTSGYYPIGNWFSRIDKRHSAFMALRFYKK